VTAKRQTPQEACKTTLACSRRSVNNQNLTNIMCVKMLREIGVPSADLSGIDSGKAGQGTWHVDLLVANIDIKNTTTGVLFQELLITRSGGALSSIKAWVWVLD